MFKLSAGYFISGIITGLVLLVSFLRTIPDGKLRLVFCDVGQGDAAYIRFPDGRDMLIDGGPNNKVLQCLGKHMPFWDRRINIVVLTHPQKDHLQGLLSVFERYDVGYFVRSDVGNTTEGYKKLVETLAGKKIPVKLVTQGETITVGVARLTVLWPSTEQIARMKGSSDNVAMKQCDNDSCVLGATAPTNLNDGSVVLWLRYGSFDALFPGDADTRVESGYQNEVALRLAEARSGQALNVLEVLKVPHHGSKTGISQEFSNWLYPQKGNSNCSFNNESMRQWSNCLLAVISVGNNSYGHPAGEILEILRYKDIKILRTDQEGDIEVVSDGRGWQARTVKENKGN